MDSFPLAPEHIQGRDFVVTGQQPWDVAIGSNCKNIAEQFSRHNRVLYVNPPLDRFTAFRDRKNKLIIKRKEVVNGRRDAIEQVSGSMWILNPDRMLESINWISSQALFEILNLQNNRRFADCIKRAISQLGFRDILLFNDNDMFRSFHLKELLQPALSIYYSRDFMLAVDYWKKHGRKIEPQLIANSDLCLANSVYLANYCRQYNPQSYYVGQGCDLEAFQTGIGSPVPEDLKHIKRPVIGYVGALQSIRLDINLIAHIAVSRPDWSIVLVGPEDEQFRESQLHSMSNVYFTGAKPVEAIPAYINAFDLCFNPQLINEVTIGNYPRKIDEYLSMGKPVLATATDAMSIFAAHTYLGTTKEDYLALAEQALTEDNPVLQQQRIRFASGHTWENNAQDIYKAIKNRLTRKEISTPTHTRHTTLPQHLFILGTPRHDDDLESTSFMLARELTKYFQVYYIDNPFTYRDYLRTRNHPKCIKRAHLFEPGSDGILDIGIDRLRVIITPLLYSIHFQPEGRLYRWLLKKNEAIIRRRIQQVLDKAGIPDFIFINSFNFHYPQVTAGLKPVLNIYQSFDPLVMDFDRKHGVLSEPQIIKESDMVIYTARSLSEQFREINPETYFLPNAADINHSSKALDGALPVHPFLQPFSMPVVGYFGNIERRIDYALLETTARQLKHYSFVFTGPYNEHYIPESFRALPNVHFTGKVPYAEMPAVLKGYDVAIIPFRTDEASSAIFPLKLFEYLGAGKPVVSTLFNPDLRLLTGNAMHYHSDPELFAAAIVEAYEKDTDELKTKRISLAAENTWQHRARQLVDLMETALKKKLAGQNFLNR